ncbi:hypothetical protein Tco_1156627 [Tanacetum coccineum]
MANLKYSDKHNMVAFLKKPNESVGFTEVVDFLKGTSLSQNFANGTQQLVASIDHKELYHSLRHLSEPHWGVAVDQGEGSAQPAEPHHTPVDLIPSTSQPHIPSRPHPSPLHQSPPYSPHQTPPHSPHQTTPHSLPHLPPHSPPHSPPHLPHQTPPHSPLQSPPYSPPHYSPPSLEKKLKETKQTLGNAVVKLVKKVKSLELALKRKSKKVIVSESEGEEPEDQGRIIQDIDDDPLVFLVRESIKKKSIDFVTPTKASSYNLGGSQNIVKVDSGTASKRGQREGKAPMVEEDIQATHKTKEQIRQEEAGLEEAIKLQAQMDEENQGTWKLSQLKKLRFEEIKEEFDKLVQQIDTFVPMDFEATKAKLKIYGEELQTKTSKNTRLMISV